MKKRLFFLFSALVMLFCSLTVIVSADESCYLQISYTDDEIPVCDASFSLYYLGTEKDGVLQPDAAFSSYQLDFSVSDTEKRKTLAMTLEAYALRDNAVPMCRGITDENGFTDFDGKSFPRGVYLLTGEKHYQNEKYYVAQPVIIILPYGDRDSVIVKPKYEKYDESDKELTTVRVIKSWQNDSAESRPDSIEVQLFCNGEIYDTKTLNADGSWQCVWTELDASSRWTVTEKAVSDGYRVSISLSDNTFIITNEREDSEEDTTVPDSDIPETGMLMWPIPYLALAGLLIFIIGFVYYRKSEMKNDTTE